MPAPRLLDDHVRFEAALPAVDGHPVEAVRLDADDVVAGGRDFARVAADGATTSWRLDLPRPPLQRFEYRFDVTAGGTTRTVLDPDNPARVPTAFGDRSVMAMPAYAAPGWLSAPAVPGTRTEVSLVAETAEPVPMTVWSPVTAGTDDALPMLLVHDGPEYDRLAALTQFSGAMIAAGRVAPHRVALATPVLRDAWYSGSPTYLRTEAGAGLTHLAEQFPTRGPVVVMGASLGGLTALLVGLLSANGAGTVGGVFSQSGSFFTVHRDDQESGFKYFGRITRAVQQVLDAPGTEHPLRVAMTCGSLEENAGNNRDMAAALARAGHDVTYREVPDLHNYTAWRDSLDPSLTDLLAALWGQPPC
ncbi:conserved hypothetical protein [Nostocoides japonicum T1-X7]|uniref:Esterase n=1 Tax=Nostocoides japonicum T1-X7 TaxID=1194083 RepID=A0A077LY31_9MICO|nr:alpha/beta hydrolase-fold protein [Tetrasphaera japonica]CCH78808.1 conserved hypothetical protein [Tetrasphaera japonica T1-X7]